MRVVVALTAVAVAVLVALTAAVHPPVAGGATLAAKRAQAAKIAAQVDKLDSQLSDLQERYRSAQGRLQSLDATVSTLTDELQAQQRDLGIALGRLSQRAVTVYENGADTSTIVHLAEAHSLSNFVDRVDTMQRVGQQDADIVGQIRTLRAKVAHKRSQLKSVQSEQRVLVHQARKERDSIAGKLRSRQRVLSSVNGEIRAMVDAQRAAAAARAAAESQAAADRLRANLAAGGGADAPAGASIVPSQSVDAGTALQPSAPAPPASCAAAQAASIAMAQIGKPYVWGAAGPSSFDCSGLVVYSFGQVGISLPHSSYSLWNAGTHVSRDQLEVGDLVFFDGLGHVGIYVGGGNFVHAPHTGTTVQVSSLNSSYGASAYVGAVRI